MDDLYGALTAAIGDDQPTQGPLSGLTFLAKDIFDVADYPTRAGNPEFADWRGLPTQDAWAVAVLRSLGARLVGKTHTHELAYGITGINPHFGTPKNPRVPGGIPGGSSSGSAVAIGAGLADFALGSDTGGSIRAPASFCGIYGFRPTHGHIPLDGVVPLAPSFDTVGVFSQSPRTLEQVVGPLLRPPFAPGARGFARALIATDALESTLPQTQNAVWQTAGKLEALGIAIGETQIGTLSEIYQAQGILQGAEAWAVHQEWIEARQPKLGADVARLLDMASRRTVAEIGKASAERARLGLELQRLVGNDTLLLIPAALGPAPLIAELENPEAAQGFRIETLKLMNPASLAGLPVVVIPTQPADQPPIGVQLVGFGGSDLGLLGLAKALG